MITAQPLGSVARTALGGLIGLGLLIHAGCTYAFPDPLNSIVADLVMGHPGFSPFTIRVINDTGRNAELDVEIDGVPALAPIVCSPASFRCDMFFSELPQVVSLLELRLYDNAGIQVAGQDFRGLAEYTLNWPLDFRYRSTLLIRLTPMRTELEVVF